MGAWKWIRKTGFTLQVPRPKHIQSASEEEVAVFKKSGYRMFENQASVSRHPIELWSQDEARLGLQSTIRRTWSLKGKRIVAVQIRKYQWVYVYAFVHLATGKSFWLILPSVNTELMNLALREFSEYIDPKREKIIVLLIDGAGWHRSKEWEIPENIRAFPIPPYSPELQPVESGWSMLKEFVANGCYENLNALQKVVAKRCDWLGKNPDELNGAVGFRWIQEIESNSN